MLRSCQIRRCLIAVIINSPGIRIICIGSVHLKMNKIRLISLIKSCLLIGFLFLASLQGEAQTPKAFNSADQQKILKVLEDQRVAWNKSDMEEYMQGYWKSDSLVFVGKSGPEYGWQNILDNYKKAYPDKKAMGFLTFDIREIRVLNKENAFVVGAWHLKMDTDEQRGYFTLLLEKINGQWKVVADHSS